MKPTKKPNKALRTVLYVVVTILLSVIAVGAFVGIEYGRYMCYAPDNMDFSTFVWIDTMRR